MMGASLMRCGCGLQFQVPRAKKSDPVERRYPCPMCGRDLVVRNETSAKGATASPASKPRRWIVAAASSGLAATALLGWFMLKGQTRAAALPVAAATSESPTLSPAAKPRTEAAVGSIDREMMPLTPIVGGGSGR